MRKGVVLAVVAVMTAATAAWAQDGKAAKPETLLRWHFAGTKHLATVQDLKTMTEVLALPETRALGEAAARNLAARAAGRFNKSGDTNSNPELTRLIQPLLPDVWQNESRFHMSAQGAQDADWMLAVKLAGNRSEEWSKALAELAKRAGMQGASANASEWTARREDYRLSFSKAKDWTVIEGGFGEPDAKIAKEFRASLGQRQGKRVLEAEVASPLLAKIWSAAKLTHGPKVTLTAEPKGDGIYSEIVIDYPEDLGIKPEKWNVPAGLIREPLVGFTAIQGIRKRLEANEKFRKLGAKETPNQLFVWAQDISPFSTSMALEVKNPAEVITNAARALREVKLPAGKLVQSTNRPLVFWEGLPFIVPFLEAAPAPYASFVSAGFFPVQMTPDKKNAAPPELFAQLNKKKDLVFYQWEITGERLGKWVPLWQLRYLVGGHFVPVHKSPSAQWLQALKTRTGNTVTEGTLENARRVKLVRQSGLGFSALELVLLAHWADAGDLSPAPVRKGQKGQKTQPNNVPAPALP